MDDAFCRRPWSTQWHWMGVYRREFTFVFLGKIGRVSGYFWLLDKIKPRQLSYIPQRKYYRSSSYDALGNNSLAFVFITLTLELHRGALWSKNFFKSPLCRWVKLAQLLLSAWSFSLFVASKIWTKVTLLNIAGFLSTLSAKAFRLFVWKTDFSESKNSSNIEYCQLSAWRADAYLGSGNWRKRILKNGSSANLTHRRKDAVFPCRVPCVHDTLYSISTHAYRLTRTAGYFNLCRPSALWCRLTK